MDKMWAISRIVVVVPGGIKDPGVRVRSVCPFNARPLHAQWLTRLRVIEVAREYVEGLIDHLSLVMSS